MAEVTNEVVSQKSPGAPLSGTLPPLSGQHEFPTINFEGRLLSSAASASIGAVFINGKPDWTRTGEIQLIHVDQLVQHPWNPRTIVDPRDMLATTESVNSQGVHTPLHICQFGSDAEKGLILSGHRRLWVVEGLGADLIPCRLDPRRVLSEVEQREELIRANEGQEPPAPIDHAKGILAYMACTTPPLNQSQAAKKLGMHPVAVSNLLRLLILPEKVQELINKRALNESVAIQIARTVAHKEIDADRIINIAEAAAENKWPVRRVLLALTGKESSNRGIRKGGNNRFGPSNKSPEQNTHSSGGPRPSPTPVQSMELDLSGGLKVRFTTNRTELTDERMHSALSEAIMQVPVEFGGESTGVSPVSAPSDTLVIQPTDSGRERPGRANDLKVKQRESLAEPPRSTTATTPTDLVVEETPTSPEAELDPYGLRAPITYDFPQVEGATGQTYKSAAAHSINAVFIDGYPDWSRCEEVQLIFKSALRQHPWNPRVTVTAEAMRTTLLSVKASGIHTPLAITRHAEDIRLGSILGGHRRTWAAHKLPVDLVPCRLDPRGLLSEIQVRETLLGDNIGQVRIPPIDRAQSYYDYVTKSGYSLSEAAARINITEAVLRRAFRLLELPEPVRQMINVGALNESQGDALRGHRGSPETVIALANRAVNEGLSTTILRTMAAASSPDLSATYGGTPDTRSLHFAVGPQRRLHVEVIAEGELPRGIELSERLKEGFTKIDQAHEVSTIDPATEGVSASQSNVRLKSIFPDLSSEVESKIIKYLGDWVGVVEGDYMVTAEVSQALRRPFTNSELKKLNLTDHDYTLQNTVRWHRLDAGGRDASEVTLAQIMSFWAGSLNSLQQLPSNLHFMNADRIFNIPLDTASVQGAGRETIARELRGRLGKVAAVLDTRILPLVRAERLAEEWRKGISEDRTLSDVELNDQGFHVSRNFRFTFNRWRGENGLSILPTEGSVNFNMLEVHRFMVDAVRSTMELSGMHLRGQIGKKQLRANSIPHSGLSDPDAERFNSREVFDELVSQIGALNRLLH